LINVVIGVNMVNAQRLISFNMTTTTTTTTVLKNVCPFFIR